MRKVVVKMNVLFMCVANSARSQMAEGLARKLFGPRVNIESAGSHPTKVNPLATKAMQEVGISLAKHNSKSYDDLAPSFIASLDYLITLCAEEVCPQMSSKAKKLHWPLPDPANVSGDEEVQLSRFRETRDVLQQRLKAFAEEAGIPLAPKIA